MTEEELNKYKKDEKKFPGFKKFSEENNVVIVPDMLKANKSGFKKYFRENNYRAIQVFSDNINDGLISKRHRERSTVFRRNLQKFKEYSFNIFDIIDDKTLSHKQKVAQILNESNQKNPTYENHHFEK